MQSIGNSRGPEGRASIIVRMLAVLMAITGAIYLMWRTTTFSPDAPLASGVFYAAEVLGYLSTLLLFVVVGKQRTRTSQPAPAELNVDIFVTTFDEDVAVVRRTLVAAKAILYPHETWLLDDGNRPAFANLAGELGCRYLARAVNTGAKAGNLNHALRHAKGDFVALFDADHCAEPQFLDRLLGYFIDPDVAFVQTPQDYYNLGSFQHNGDRTSPSIWHEQSGFHHVEQPGRDHHNAATLCGCSCVIRRSHLDMIGGFPEETVTEDMHAAVRMQKLGLKSVYHDEPLAFGVAAPDFLGFVRQRLRWGEGNMQVCRAEGLPLARQLTWRQNLCYLLLSTVYVDAWRKLVLYLAPPITIIAQVPPVNGKPGEFAVYFLPYLTLGLAAYFAHYGRLARFFATEVFAMARLSSGLLATWGLVRKRIPFRVSSKRLSGHSSWLCLLPAISILSVSLFAIAHTAARFVDPVVALTASLPLWIEIVLAFFCVYNAILAINVMMRAVRATGTHGNNYDHAIRIPVDVECGDGTAVTAWTRSVSIDRIVVGGGGFQAADDARLRIYVPGGTLDARARATLSESTGEVSFLLDWQQIADRDVLDQMLHARRWHRFVEGRSEFMRRRWLPLFRPEPSNRVWEPVIASGSKGAGMLAYLEGDGRNRRAIVFGAIGIRPFHVIASWSGRFDGLMLMPGLPGALDDDCAALEGVAGRCVEVKAALVAGADKQRQPERALPVYGRRRPAA